MSQWSSRHIFNSQFLQFNKQKKVLLVVKKGEQDKAMLCITFLLHNYIFLMFSFHVLINEKESEMDLNNGHTSYGHQLPLRHNL